MRRDAPVAIYPPHGVARLVNRNDGGHGRRRTSLQPALFGRRFSDRPRPDAKSYEVLGDASVSRPRSSVRNDSPNAEPSRKTPPLRVPPINLRRRAGSG